MKSILSVSIMLMPFAGWTYYIIIIVVLMMAHQPNLRDP